MKVEFKGTVEAIFPAKIVGADNSVIREFKCSEYFFNKTTEVKNLLQFTFRYNPTRDTYDNTGVLDHIKVGQFVRFQFTIKGRDWKGQNGKVMNFTTLRVVSAVEVLKDFDTCQVIWSSSGSGIRNSSVQTNATAASPSTPTAPVPNDPSAADPDEDLPF